MMKRGIILLIVSMLALDGITQEAKFDIRTSRDTILMDNYFEVRFELENANGSNFEAPTFEGFNRVGGPNHASSFSMVNGEVSQRMSISYFLEPVEPGTYYIGPAFIEVDGEIMETKPHEVVVLENPEGIKQKDRAIEEMPLLPDDPFPEPKKPKKKRKIYKI